MPMRHVAGYLSTSGSRPEPQHGEQRGGPDERCDRFWLRMTETYGHRWVSQYGEEPTSGWCQMVRSLSDEQVRRGLAACLDRARSRVERGESDWPPGLAEFYALCQRPRTPSYHRALPRRALKVDREALKRHLGAMRAALAGKAA